MQNKQLWYTRRGNEIRGPFPAQQISRFILLGRIHDSDELSVDQHEWQKVSDVPILIPEELKTDLSDPKAHERLLIARMREDERNARDRRDENEADNPVSERRQRSSDERRSDEEEDIIRHREIKTAITEAAKHRQQNYFLRGMLVTFILVGIVTGAWVYQPWQPQDNELVNCNAAPQPWVNFSNCLMDGVKMVNADLRGARMRNANLAGSDLRGSQLGGADLAYSNLVSAQLSAAMLNQAVLVGANLRNANLENADLTNANLAYAILQGTVLNNTNLTGADMSNADLQGADLATAKLDGAKLDKAIWIDGSVCLAGSIGECKH